jgi:isopentenyl-diphosphate Delta-isomerase
MAIVGENPELFESRKADHIRLALESRMQAIGGSGLDRISLIHEAFPEIDFKDVSLSVPFLKGRETSSPLFISSMTAGHAGSIDLNLVMARVAEKRNWLMGVGSQRRQLTDPAADAEWIKIRKACPRVRLLGNVGVSQLITTKVSEIRRLADTLQAEAMFVHTNPLQECLQPEGTPQFAGGLKALEHLVKELDLPVIVKETGCGFSTATLRRLQGMGISAVDVGGFGGTHWGRIEGGRSKPGEPSQVAAETFRDWGISTVDSIFAAVQLRPDFQVWASGGVRSGLDAAKLVALGAKMVGLAKPIIEAALHGEEVLEKQMDLLEFEMKIALFCTGHKSVKEFQRQLQKGTEEGRVWQWAKKMPRNI